MTSPLWQAHVLTLFPEMFPGALGHSLPGKALQAGLWQLHTHHLRDYAQDRHHRVDDTPYGGGAGMVMRADVVDAALAALPQPMPIFYLSPRGRPLNQAMLQRLAAQPAIALLCGRYEGVDQRVLEAWAIEEISLGDFVLAGGEIPAMAVLEGVVRLLPGVLGNAQTVLEESFAAGLLEYPHYTRPADWQGRAVPEILLSGDHAKIQAWRQQQARIITQQRRPELWEAYNKGPKF